ncbi:MAG: FmdB family zinc ribbon protein [Planctomycetota bacterium]
MPIYEYVCPRCDHRFEELQRMGDAGSPPCEKCGCVRTERQFSTFAMGGGGGSGGSGSGSSCSGCARSSCAGCNA